MDRPIYRILHLIFALGLAHALFLLGQEGMRAYQLAQEKVRLEEALRQAEARVARLEAEVKAAGDPAYLEALVRRLGFARQEERLVSPEGAMLKRR